MILKLKVKKNKKSKGTKIYLWIQRHKDFEQDIQQILLFFKDQILVSKRRRFLSYYRISSDNPAIILSLFSTVQDLIPEVYFREDPSVEIEEKINP